MKYKTSASHTPGPWTLNGPQVTANGDWKAPVCICVSKVDTRPTHDAAAKDQTTAVANANLIAAAPELLAALEWAWAMLDGLAGDDRSELVDNEGYTRTEALLAQLHAAPTT